MMSLATQSRCFSFLGLAMAVTVGTACPAVAGHHPDVKIKIVQYGGYPTTATVTTGAASPLQVFTGSAAPVMLNAAPVMLNAAPTTFSSGTYLLAPSATNGGSLSGSAAPSSSSGDKIKVTIGSATGLVDRSSLATLLKETGEAAGTARAPGGSDNAQAAPATNQQQIYLIAAPQAQAAPTQQIQVQAAPAQVQFLAAPAQVQMLAAPSQIVQARRPRQSSFSRTEDGVSAADRFAFS